MNAPCSKGNVISFMSSLESLEKRPTVIDRKHRMSEFKGARVDAAHRTTTIKPEIPAKPVDKDASKEEQRKKELRAKMLFDYIEKCEIQEKALLLKVRKEEAARKRDEVARREKRIQLQREHKAKQIESERKQLLHEVV